MKKGIGIVFMLTLVVVVASLGVFFVEDITTPIIEDRQIKEVQEAVSEVFPEIVGTTWTVEDYTGELSLPITGAKTIVDGETLQGIVYTVSFQGFANTFTYVVGVNRAGEVTGYKTLKNNETASSAGDFNESETFAAINGALLSAAGSSFDGVSGATYTSDYWRTSLDQVAEWHSDAELFDEIPQIDVDQALIRSKLADETLVLTELSAANIEKLDSSSIDYAYEATGDSGDYVVYIEEYSAYEAGTKVLLVVNDDHETVLFEVLASSDTPDWGGKLLTETDRWTQLEDQSLNFLINGAFDGLGGATTTYSTWQDAMYRISAFHQEVYQGIITYSMDTLVPEYQSQLSPVTLGGMTTWTIASDAGIDLTTGNDGSGLKVSWDNPGVNYESITIEQGGFNFEAGKLYSINVVAHSENEKDIWVSLNDGTEDLVLTKLALEALNEDLSENTYSISYNPSEDVNNITLSFGLGKTVAKEEDGNATIVEVTIVELVGEYNVPDQATNQVINSKLETTRVIEVTNQKYKNINISNVFDIVNDKGEVEGTIYYGYTFGTYIDGPTMINFMLGIDKDGNYTGFRFLGTTDPHLNPSEIYTADYEKFLSPGYFAEEIEGLAITSVIDLANYDGLELQLANIEGAINEIGRYHVEDYTKRFLENIDTDELKLALSGSNSFVSIYNDFDAVDHIVNVYEAYDATNTLVGYVYAGEYEGNNSDILFTLGVNLTGVVTNLNVYSGSESWTGAGKSTNFLDSDLLDAFDGLDVTLFVSNYTPAANPTKGGVSTDVDAISGVSTTTGGDGVHFGLIDSVYTLLNFHEENSVGGAE